jgi:hypothetical protein
MALRLTRIYGFQMQRQGRAAFWWRRLPSLLPRGFPNRSRYAQLARPAYEPSADWEIGDTAGWETCGTSAQIVCKILAGHPYRGLNGQAGGSGPGESKPEFKH